MRLPFLILLLALAGCSRLRVHQHETPQGDRDTITTVTTFWDSKSELAKFRASTTDKTQSTSIGGLAESSSGSSNTMAIIEAITGAAIKAAVKP